MNKKITVLFFILLLIVLSQWLLIKLVYRHAIKGSPAVVIANIYHLKAGSVNDDGSKTDIALADFLAIRNFNGAFKDPEIQNMDLDALTWNRVLKNYWLNKFAEEKSLTLEEGEVQSYMDAYIEDQVDFEQSVENDFGVSFEDYKKFIIESGVLEAKVYNYLIANYNDLEGVAQAQGAYDALNAGQDFYEVAKNFSDDTTLADSSIFLSEDQMLGIYEPIKGLAKGEFSKIVYVPFPTGYVIWYVASDVEQDGQMLKEIKAIFINAMPLEDFFDAYMEKVEVNKYY